MLLHGLGISVVNTVATCACGSFSRSFETHQRKLMACVRFITSNTVIGDAGVT